MLIRVYERELEIRDRHTLELIRRHPLATPKGEVKLPDAERVFNPSRQTYQILARAELIGPNILALCRELFAQRGREAQKSIWGIVGLSPRYPACIHDQAAAVAVARQSHSYNTVRVLAEHRLPRHRRGDSRKAIEQDHLRRPRFFWTRIAGKTRLENGSWKC